MSESIANLELKLSDNEDNHSLYRGIYSASMSGGKESLFNHIRYMLALANDFNEVGGHDSYMFMGGLGVLGNMIDYMGEQRIPYWREIHDLDVVLKSRDYGFIAFNFFDFLDVGGKSISIVNKWSYKGSSYDFDGSPLDETHLDVYIPEGDPRKGVLVDRIMIGEREWERRKTSLFFGIPVSVLDPLTLLRMKLNITSNKKNRRSIKDCQDTVNLLRVLELDGYNPCLLRAELSDFYIDKIRNIFGEGTNSYCSVEELNDDLFLLKPSEDYLEEIIKSEEDEPDEDIIIE